jgi:multidrug resistance efflux pump
MSMQQTNQKNEEGGRKKITDSLKQNPKLVLSLAIFIALAAVGGAAYLIILQSRVYIEKSEISAPTITLTPLKGGTIDKLYVNVGETVRKNQLLAKVGDETIKAPTAGIIIDTSDTPGQMAGPQTPIVQMIDPRELRVIGRLEEDKGLADVRVGQNVIFTVDAFGSEEFEGVVEEIAPSARQSDVVFSISDKREVREFNIKATFDQKAYPQLKNGMSAEMWVYK